MSIYSVVADKYGHEYLTEAAREARRSYPQEAGFGLQDTPDQEPLLGISYSLDFRAEEEAGAGELARTVNNATRQSDHVRMYGDHLIVSIDNIAEKSSFLSQVERFAGFYRNRIRDGRGSATSRLERHSMSELRQMVKDQNLPHKGVRKKADFVDLLVSRQVVAPKVWPAWFQYGNTLILRSEDQAFQAVLTALAQEAEENQLAVSANSQVFSGSLGLYSKRDVGPLLHSKWNDEREFYRTHMTALVPVAEELAKKGHKWYFLGKPALLKRIGDKELQVCYWLNGHGYGSLGQPFGWYTLDELLDEKFMRDLQERKKNN